MDNATKQFVTEAINETIGEHLKELEKIKEAEKIVKITTSFGKYSSCYTKGKVLFGCAHIDNHIIREAFALTRCPMILGNRKVESVTIGLGVFTAEDLSKLTANLID